MREAAGRRRIAGLAEIDREHQLQIALVDAFEKAAGANEPAEGGRILEQMADLSEMHFLAEELVMQLHQYAAYQEHANEHAQLLEEMDRLLKQNAAGTLGLTLELANRLRRTLAHHLAGADYALSAYLREEGIVETDPGTAPS